MGREHRLARARQVFDAPVPRQDVEIVGLEGVVLAVYTHGAVAAFAPEQPATLHAAVHMRLPGGKLKFTCATDGRGTGGARSGNGIGATGHLTAK